jgi:endonuclease/exonuclease/phosphatase family metal-dependent hydrolase
MPGGRYASGCTLGVRFTGVCIPWRDAHVRTGRRDRKAWQDHLSFLEHLGPIVAQQISAAAPLCLLGDFNQRVPRHRQPPHVYEALQRVVTPALTCVTGDGAGVTRGLIDHVAVEPRMVVVDLVTLPKVTSDGVRLSDHEGVVVTLAVA